MVAFMPISGVVVKNMTDDDTRSFDDVQAEVTQHGEYEALHIGGSPDTSKHTTGTIDGHSFSLRVDGDAPDELVARIESALADLKAGGYTPTDKLKILATQWQKAAYAETRKEKYTPNEVDGLVKAADELEALLDDTQDNE